MAAPHVAGAAALVVSSGITDPAQVRQALVSAVQPFPTYGNRWDCTVMLCGAGILDLSKLEVGPVVSVPGAPTGVSAAATSTTRATLQWTAPADDGGAAITEYRLAYARDGGSYSGFGTTAGTSTDVSDLVPGASYQFRVAAVNSAGVGDFSQPSAPLVMPTEMITVPGQVNGFSSGRFTRTGTGYRVNVRWSAPVDDGGTAVTGYEARLGRGKVWTSWSDLARPVAVLTDLRRDTKYRLQVRAVNSEGLGAPAAYTFRTPLR